MTVITTACQDQQAGMYHKMSFLRNQQNGATKFWTETMSTTRSLDHTAEYRGSNQRNKDIFWRFFEIIKLFKLFAKLNISCRLVVKAKTWIMCRYWQLSTFIELLELYSYVHRLSCLKTQILVYNSSRQ